MTRSTIVAHIEGPLREGTVIDTPDGARCVEKVEREKDSGRFVLEVEEVVVGDPAQAIYPVLCPMCDRVFIYAVEPNRFLSAQDMDKVERKRKFFRMPDPCQECRSLPSKTLDRRNDV